MANEFRFSGVLRDKKNEQQNWMFTSAADSKSTPKAAMLRFTVEATTPGSDRTQGIRLVAFGAVAEALREQVGKEVDVRGHITGSVSKKDGKFYENKIVDAIVAEEVA